MRFEGKTALITGGGTGIGAAVARRIAFEGGMPVLVGRRLAMLQPVAEETGGFAAVGDAASGEDMRRVLASIKERFGGLDILVSNAGGHGMGLTTEMSDETWRESGRSNLDTLFVSARECLPALIERSGNIVVVSSVAGLFAGPDAAGYVTMKHACIGLGKSLARDYGRKGVRTNIVCPGWVETAMADGEMEHLVGKLGLSSIAEAYKIATKDVPLGRPAAAEDVANLVCFLASSEARMMNGAICTIDGGASVVDLPTLAFAD